MEIAMEKLQLMSMMTPKMARQMYVETCEELQYTTWLNPEHRNRRRKTEVYKIPNVWAHVLIRYKKKTVIRILCNLISDINVDS
jgi:hypothetical protein